MSNDQRKIAQMKLYRLWKSGDLAPMAYAAMTVALFRAGVSHA